MIAFSYLSLQRQPIRTVLAHGPIGDLVNSAWMHGLLLFFAQHITVARPPASSPLCPTLLGVVEDLKKNNKKKKLMGIAFKGFHGKTQK